MTEKVGRLILPSWMFAQYQRDELQRLADEAARDWGFDRCEILSYDDQYREA